MALHDFRSQRLFIENEINENDCIETSREQANYLLNVLRMKDTDQLLIFNGKDGEWRAGIEATGRKKCNLIVHEQTRPQPTRPNLIYCFAPLKQARLDYMVQKAVEMGVGTLQPIITQYTQVRAVNEKRIYSNAIEAAEQCGVLTIPEINEPAPLLKLDHAIGKETLAIFCDENAPQENSLGKAKRGYASATALIIGPEGGFSPEEREMLHSRAHTLTLGLGPRILRADTAAVAALAVFQATLGDWYK